MDIQLITYRGRSLAACTATRVFISDEIEQRGPDDPLTRFVLEMCMYAGQVFTGLRPGPYFDHDARAYARLVLIPSELLEPPVPEGLNDEHVANEIGVPVDELRLALADTRNAAQPGGRMR